MIVVSDTSPLLALFYLGKLDLLRLLYNEIIIPRAVYNELLQSKLDESEKSLFGSNPFRVIAAEDTAEVTRLLSDIQLGEAEAIVLSEQMHAISF